MCEISSIIRCIGPKASEYTEELAKRGGGLHNVYKVLGNENDLIIWFANSTYWFGEHVDGVYLLVNLEKMGKGQTLSNSYPTDKRFSGTIYCY